VTTANKAAKPEPMCQHHYRETERNSEVAVFVCLKCQDWRAYPIDPPLRVGAPGWRQGATLLGARAR
jgi:hypothetical protein